MNKKVVLVGAGNVCRDLVSFFNELQIEDICIVDNAPQKWGNAFLGYSIEKPKEWEKCRNSWFFITPAEDKVKCEIRDIMQREYGYDLTQELSIVELIIWGYSISECLHERLITSKTIKKKNPIAIFGYAYGLGLGGVESWIIQLSKELSEYRPGLVRIVTREGDYHLEDSVERIVRYFGYNNKGWLNTEAVINTVIYFANHRPCTAIVNIMDEFGISAMVAKRLFPEKINVIAVTHNDDKWMYDTYMNAMRYIDSIMCVSKEIMDNYVKLGCDTNKLVHMAIPAPWQKSITRNYALQNEPIRIGYAGRMDALYNDQKRLDLIIDLLAELRNRKVLFLAQFAGDGPGKYEIEEYSNQKGLSKFVVFRGRIPREEMRFFWEKIDIYISLSDYEGRSLSRIEAMACGAVPVVTDVSGVNEDIVDGESGFIVPIGDIKLAARRIEELSNNRKMLIRMGENAYDTIRDLDDMEGHVEVWKMILWGKLAV